MPEVLEGLQRQFQEKPEGSVASSGFARSKMCWVWCRHIQGIRVKREKINTNAANPATNAKVLRSLGARTTLEFFSISTICSKRYGNDAASIGMVAGSFEVTPGLWVAWSYTRIHTLEAGLSSVNSQANAVDANFPIESGQIASSFNSVTTISEVSVL